MKIYNYSKFTGEYLGVDQADESPLEPGVFLIPSYATSIPVPVLEENQTAVFENNNWVVRDDYRGQTACEVDANCYFIKIHEFMLGEKPTTNIILANVPDYSIYKPKWDGAKWTQGDTPPVTLPNIEERLASVENAIAILMGV